MLIEDGIELFKIYAPMMVPVIFDIKNLYDVEIREDEGILFYKLQKPIEFEELMNELEDQMEYILLYHHQPVEGIKFGQSCCSYSNPKYGHMFKINAETNLEGTCERVSVTIYDSLDDMYGELLKELRLKIKSGKYLYRKDECSVMSDFF
ncbi:MAG: hypothetical protein ACRCZY_09295 [Phocaeicola sp.]